MFMLGFLLVTLLFTNSALTDVVTDVTELAMVFMVHRHGDRTPTTSTIEFSDMKQALKELTLPYGYGQLTTVGKQRSYEMGKFIRERYSNFLSPQYNSSEIYLRSTDSTRAKMTVLTAMNSVYPAAGVSRWSEEINWTPVPYTTLPAKYDFNLAFLNCPVYTEAFYSMFYSNSSRMDKYSYLFKLFGDYEEVLNEKPLLMYTFYDLFTSQISLGLPLKPELEEVFSEITAAAGEAIDVLVGDDAYAALQAGPMLAKFFDVASSFMAGNGTQSIRVYSAHDISVYSWISASRVQPRPGVPKYSSIFALELRRVVETGQYVVLPVYVSSPGEEVQYLEVEGCGSSLCDIDLFREITAPYTINETEWRTKCEFYDDLEVDESNI